MLYYNFLVPFDDISDKVIFYLKLSGLSLRVVDSRFLSRFKIFQSVQPLRWSGYECMTIFLSFTFPPLVSLFTG